MILLMVKRKFTPFFFTFCIHRVKARLETLRGRYNFTRYITQLLLMASEEDLTDPAMLDLFLKCGESFDK